MGYTLYKKGQNGELQEIARADKWIDFAKKVERAKELVRSEFNSSNTSERKLRKICLTGHFQSAYTTDNNQIKDDLENTPGIVDVSVKDDIVKFQVPITGSTIFKQCVA